MTNRSYYCLLYSLVRIGDIEGAEDFLKKWGSVKIFNDIRILHVLLLVYIKKKGGCKKQNCFLTVWGQTNCQYLGNPCRGLYTE
jgi:pentatricopeptide repeat protein